MERTDACPRTIHLFSGKDVDRVRQTGLREREGKEDSTISLMYSVKMSSRTATDSGSGFGSSPKAYMSNLTVVRRRGGSESTVFLEEVLFPCDPSARMVSHGVGEEWQVVRFAQPISAVSTNQYSVADFRLASRRSIYLNTFITGETVTNSMTFLFILSS